MRGFKLLGVLINYGKCKMQPMDFVMLKMDGLIHVPCCQLMRHKTNHQPIIMNCVNKI
jgi:hypothetical protein